jgi:hypothetical protein
MTQLTNINARLPGKPLPDLDNWYLLIFNILQWKQVVSYLLPSSNIYCFIVSYILTRMQSLGLSNSAKYWCLKRNMSHTRDWVLMKLSILVILIFEEKEQDHFARCMDFSAKFLWTATFVYYYTIVQSLCTQYYEVCVLLHNIERVCTATQHC